MNKNLNIEKLISFLEKVDNDFPIPLSKKVNLREYAYKLNENAEIISLEYNGVIAGIVAGYTTNLLNNNAYIAIVAVDNKYRGRGIATKLIKNFINICEEKKIKEINLYTHMSNYGAIKLYSRLGFIECLDSDKQRINDIFFVKKLG